MSEWITDRLPTLADADDNEEVQICYEPGGLPQPNGVHVHCSVVVPGQPWWSRRAADRTAPPPAPARTRYITAMTTTTTGTIVAACNDGTVQTLEPDETKWYNSPWIRSIPQPEAHNA
jgi:hypothetical protein